MSPLTSLIKITHGITWIDLLYPNNFYATTRNGEFKIELPYELEQLLLKKARKWSDQGLITSRAYKIPFTLGKLEVKNKLIYSIAIVHPRDQFKRKIGVSIVKGRITKEFNQGYEKSLNTIFIFQRHVEPIS